MMNDMRERRDVEAEDVHADAHENDFHISSLSNPSLITLQKQVKSLTTQVRVLKRMAITNLFSNKEEMVEFMNDIW
jgi:hypothetical protein